MPTSADYKRWEKFSGYRSVSNRAIGAWNEVVNLGNRIRGMSSKEARKNMDDVFDDISDLQDMVEGVRHSTGSWYNVPFHKDSLNLAIQRDFGPYAISEGLPYDTLLGIEDSILNDLKEDMRDKFRKTFDYLMKDSQTGKPLYFDSLEKNYKTFRESLDKIEKPEQAIPIKTTDKIQVSTTSSLDYTAKKGKGHANFAAEASGTAIVRNKNQMGIDETLEEICKKLTEELKSTGDGSGKERMRRIPGQFVVDGEEYTTRVTQVGDFKGEIKIRQRKLKDVIW